MSFYARFNNFDLKIWSPTSLAISLRSMVLERVIISNTQTIPFLEQKSYKELKILTDWNLSLPMELPTRNQRLSLSKFFSLQKPLVGYWSRDMRDERHLARLLRTTFHPDKHHFCDLVKIKSFDLLTPQNEKFSHKGECRVEPLIWSGLIIIDFYLFC